MLKRYLLSLLLWVPIFQTKFHILTTSIAFYVDLFKLSLYRGMDADYNYDSEEEVDYSKMDMVGSFTKNSDVIKLLHVDRCTQMIFSTVVTMVENSELLKTGG